MRKAIFLVSIFTISIFTATAQIGGNAVYQFLKVPISPRVAGAGGNVIANTEGDVVFGLWNPALINENMHGKMSLSVAPSSGGLLFGEAAYSHTFDKAGSFLVGIKYLDYGDLQLTNTQAQVQGKFFASDYALQFGYGYQLDSNFQFGVSLKVINSTYETYSSWGLATDFSAVYQIPKSRLSMALMLKNVGFQLSTFDGQREKMPIQVDYGISTRFAHVPLRLNLTLENLQKMDLSYNDPNIVTTDPITGEEVVEEIGFGNKLLRHVAFGAELAPSRNFNIQLAYNFRRRLEMDIPTRRSAAGLSFGIGIKISKFRINYANTNLNVAGRMHHIGITTWLDEFGKKKGKNNNI